MADTLGEVFAVFHIYYSCFGVHCRLYWLADFSMILIPWGLPATQGRDEPQGEVQAPIIHVVGDRQRGKNTDCILTYLLGETM